MMLRVKYFFFFLLIVKVLSAQEQDTVYSIGGVEIKADRISSFSSGLKSEKFDTTTLFIRQGATIASLLSDQSALFVRSYSPGGLATLTMRGTNSSQSGVFWNGINLQQPNMGMTDLSRISSFEFSDISIQSGGASALLGSGVIGGSLHLSNARQFMSPLQTSLLLTGGSPGKIAGAVKLSTGSKRVAYNGSLTGDWNKNNFWYTDFSGERVQFEHALTKSASTIHEAEFILNSKQRLIAGIWYQLTDRQIPPTMTMEASTQQQWDQAIRNSLQWIYTGEKQSFAVKSAFIDEKEHYQNEDAFIDAFYHLNTYLAEFEYKRTLSKQFSLGSGFTTLLTRADVPYYEQIEFQPKASVWGALAFNHIRSGVKSVLNLRQDFAEGYKIPFTPSLSTLIPVHKNAAASFGISRNFRIPTMNDRFWIPGGNPDLKPEESLNLEAGFEFRFKSLDLAQTKMNFDFYYLFINNMIQWVPGNAGIWSPQNVQKVRSAGVEVTSKSDFKLYGFNGYFKLAYNYTPSQYKGTETTNDDIYNNQLIYTPLHKIQETFHMSRSIYYAMFTYSFTGKRYVQSDNQKSLPSYSLLDFYTGTTLKSGKTNFRIQFEIHNLFNTSYQSILYYPEPGITFALNLLITR